MTGMVQEPRAIVIAIRTRSNPWSIQPKHKKEAPQYGASFFYGPECRSFRVLFPGSTRKLPSNDTLPVTRPLKRYSSSNTPDPMKLKLDLHDIYNRGADIDRALRSIIDEAIAKKAPMVEIIPGKGSGQLKKKVIRFLEQKEIKALYHRVEKDSKNFGRLFVHFRWK